MLKKLQHLIIQAKLIKSIEAIWKTQKETAQIYTTKKLEQLDINSQLELYIRYGI